MREIGQDLRVCAAESRPAGAICPLPGVMLDVLSSVMVSGAIAMLSGAFA
jgi:hypothetical protein